MEASSSPPATGARAITVGLAWAAAALIAGPLVGACSGQKTTAKQAVSSSDKSITTVRPDRTPLKGSQRQTGAATVVASFWEGFEGERTGAAPEAAAVRTGQGCTARVVNQPTVLFDAGSHCQKQVRDLCLELRDDSAGAGQAAVASVPFPTVASGEVELELLAWSFRGEPLELALVGPRGELRAAVVVDTEGRFFAVTPQGRRRLAATVSYKSRPPDGPLYFQPGRWFTLRLAFDGTAGRYALELINLYTGIATPGIPHLVLGADLPFLEAGPVAGVRVSTIDRAHLLVDNVTMASPSATWLSGQPRQTPLRTILGFNFPLRLDPVTLSVHGIRNLKGLRTKGLDVKCSSSADAAFRRAAVVYNRVLVGQALLQERRQNLERALYHLGARGGKVRAKHQATLGALDATRGALDRLLRAFGDAFHNAQDSARLASKFDPAARALESSLTRLEPGLVALKKDVIAAAEGKLGPGPTLAPAPGDGPLVWRNRRFERGGKPAVVYVPVGARSSDMVAGGDLTALLGLDNIFTMPIILDQPGQARRLDQQSFSWKALEKYLRSQVLGTNPGAGLGVKSMFGANKIRMRAPAWWLERNKDQQDIFFQTREGKTVPFNRRSEGRPYFPRKRTGGRYAGGGGYQARLNFWNPAVLTMFRQLFDQWAAYIKARHPGKLTYFVVGMEGRGSAVTETGFNPSAVAAFRKDLRRRYRTIGQLNKRWGTRHRSFRQIDPRTYSSKAPNGLMYDFQRFRLAGYWSWIRLIRDTIKRHLPKVVLLNDFTGAGYLDIPHGLDLPGMFKTYDLVGNHYYAKAAHRDLPNHRLLDSMRKAYGTALANYEWMAGIRSGDLFSEDVYKADALMEMFEQLAWGRSLLAVWYGGAAGFAEGAQYWVPALRNRVLRYSTGYLPVGRLRARRFGEIALTHPTVTPRLNIFDSSASFLNGTGCRATRRALSRALSAARWNYGFIDEDALLEGRQSLQGTRTLLLPRALSLAPATSRALLTWVRGGGTLVALLPPGLFDPHGRPDGSLLRATLGELSYDLRSPFKKAKVSGAGDRVSVRPVAGAAGCQLLSAAHGEGRVLLYTCADPIPEQDLLKVVQQHTRREAYARDGVFRLVLRQSRRRLFLFVVNPDLYRAREDQLLLEGRLGKAVDLGFDVAFPVPTSFSQGYTRLSLRLAPGEGTVIRLDRPAP